MPRVVIELQANTQAAVQQIQQFGKAQRDVFDAIRAANPALADATIKVSTLTQTYGELTKATQALAIQGPPAAASIQTITKAMTDARGAVVAYGTATAAQKAATSEFLDGLAAGANKAGTGLAALDKAAKDTAKGGLAALLSDIPIVGSALAKLATTLGGFPLLLGGIVGAGVGFIAFLRSVQTETTKAAAAATEFAASVENNLRKSIAAVERLRAERAGTPGLRAAGPNPALLELDRAEAEREAKRARDAALRQAETQAELARGAAPGLSEFLMPGGMMARQEKITRDLNTARLAAEGEYQTALLTIREQFKTDAVKLEDDYDKKLDTFREERLTKETKAAETQTKLLAETTREGIEFFKKLGPEAAEALKKLEFEQFVLKAREQIEQLQGVIASGADTHGTYAAALEVVTKKLDEAVKLGFIPVADAAATATEAIADSGAAATEAAAQFAEMIAAGESYTQTSEAIRQSWLAGTLSLQQYNAELGKLLANEKAGAFATKAATAAVKATVPTRAAAAAAATAAATSRGLSYAAANYVAMKQMLGTGGGGTSSGYGIEAGGAYGGYESGGGDLENYQHGGMVPGVGPVPIIAHGGERIVPVHGESGARAVQVRIEPGAIQLSGTIIDQQRGWGSLVEELGQALEARLRRRAR
jgi:hypothetical protein